VYRKTSNYVNRLIDFPNQVEDYKGTRFKVNPDNTLDRYDGHDAGRQRKTPARRQLNLCAKNGEDYVKAWYLHHLLDYIKEVKDIYEFEKILERFRENKTIKKDELDVFKCRTMTHIFNRVFILLTIFSFS